MYNSLLRSPKRWLGVLIIIGLILPQAAIAKTDLVFIVDGSGSINSTDWAIQRNGIKAALQDPLIVPRDGSVSVAVIQFSGSTRVEFPYRLIDSEADAQAAISAIQNMSQMRGSTGPGNGIVTATNHLAANGVLQSDFQSYCMSTDGTTNTGTSVGAAIAGAKTAPFNLDRYSLIAIEDPPYFNASTANSHYGPHVFGGGAVFVVNNFTQFASFVGALCLGEPLKLTGMEVTQVIQDLENNVKLVEKKKTLVRTYLEPKTGTDPVKATARLKGTRGGTALPGSPLTAINPGGSITARPNALDRRNILTDSLNFQLPDSWLTGTVTLELEGVGGTLDCQEKAGPSANDCRTTVTFNTGSEVEVKFVKVKYIDGTTTVQSSNSDLNELEKRLLATYPTARIDRTSGTLDMGNGKPKVNDVLSRLETMRFLDFCWSIWPFSCDRLYYGAVDQTGVLLNDNGAATGGKANGIPGSVSAGVIRDGNSYGRNRHAHEIGHTTGRHHAANAALVGTQVFGTTTYKKGPCGSFAANSAPDFPNIFYIGGSQRATLGPMNSGADKLVFGWDSQRNSVVDPSATFALMSYCPGYRWPSDFGYEGLRGYINSSFSTNSSSSSGTGDLVKHLLVRGIIDIDADSIEFQPFVSFELDRAYIPPSLPGNDYWLILLDENDVELDRIAFSPIPMEGEPSNPGGSGAPDDEKGLLLIPVKYDPNIVKFKVIKQSNDILLGSVIASDNAPEVSVTYPNGGEHLNPPSVTITWTASDADNDPLTFTVQFSKDNGTSWKTLVTDHVGTSLDVNLDDLGKTLEGLIRVQASDGFNTAEDVSDSSFVTPNSAPSCDITKPGSNTSFVGVQPIILEAFTSDVEDGSNLQVNWTSSLEGPIGNGSNLITELGSGSINGIRRLREGSHTITMTCTDSGGQTDTDTANILVSLTPPQIKGDVDTDGDIDRNDLLLLRQDRNKPVEGSSCGSKCDMNDDGVIDMLDMRLAALACTRPMCAVQ
jgi:hypothetical protein